MRPGPQTEARRRGAATWPVVVILAASMVMAAVPAAGGQPSDETASASAVDRQGAEVPPSLAWRVRADLGRLQPFGWGILLQRPSEPAVLLDPASGARLREVDLDCAGDGPAGVDLAGIDGDLVAVDEQTGEVGATLLPGAYQFGCELLGGYGDLTVLRPDLGARILGLRASATSAERLWEAAMLRGELCQFPPDPQVSGQILAAFDVQCEADTAGEVVLQALDVRTGEVLAARPYPVTFPPPDCTSAACPTTGQAPEYPRLLTVPPALGALGAAVVLEDVAVGGEPPRVEATLLEVRTSEEGPAWVERWRQPVAAEQRLVGAGAGVVVLITGVVSTFDPATTTFTRLSLADGTVASTQQVEVSDAGVVADDGLHLLVEDVSQSLTAYRRDGSIAWQIPSLRALTDLPTARHRAVAVGGDGGVYLTATDVGRRYHARLDGGAADPRGMIRVADPVSDDPIDVAIQACRRIVPTSQSASRVLIARDDVFADALAAASLAGPDGCILYVDGGPDAGLDLRTSSEVTRVLPAGGRVYLLGGTAAVSQTVEDALRATSYDVVRLAGDGRIDTAAAVAREVVAVRGPSTTAYVATAGSFPDAVTAGALAARRGIPLVLTEVNTLPAATRDVLAELGIDDIVVLGGTAVVSDEVLAQLPPGIRVAGRTRYGTAAEIADRLWSDDDITGAMLVAIDAEDSWAAALAATPLAARLGTPQIGVAAGLAPDESIQAVQAAGVSRLHAIGSIAVLPSAVAAAFAPEPPEPGEPPPDEDGHHPVTLVVDPADATAAFEAGLWTTDSGQEGLALLARGAFTSEPFPLPTGVIVVEDSDGDGGGDRVVEVAPDGVVEPRYVAEPGTVLGTVAASSDQSLEILVEATHDGTTDLVRIFSDGQAHVIDSAPDLRITPFAGRSLDPVWSAGGEIRTLALGPSIVVLGIGHLPITGFSTRVLWTGPEGAVEASALGGAPEPFDPDADLVEEDNFRTPDFSEVAVTVDGPAPGTRVYGSRGRGLLWSRAGDHARFLGDTYMALAVTDGDGRPAVEILDRIELARVDLLRIPARRFDG